MLKGRDGEFTKSFCNYGPMGAKLAVGPRLKNENDQKLPRRAPNYVSKAHPRPAVGQKATV